MYGLVGGSGKTNYFFKTKIKSFYSQNIFLKFTIIIVFIKKLKLATRRNCSNKFFGKKFNIVYLEVIIAFVQYVSGSSGLM